MNRAESEIWLIRAMQKEMPRYAGYSIPKEDEDRWKLLRGLFNVRPPIPASAEFLRIQDELLQEITREKGVTDWKTLQPCPEDPDLYLWQGDITTLNVDAIVNAANSGLLGCFRPNHSCIDNIIHTMSGIELRLKCAQLMEAQGDEEPTGQAKLTPAYNLPCRYVLHTVGPIVDGPLTKEHCELLASCYRSCLDAADGQCCESVAFCCISTGVFAFPQWEAAEIAVGTVKRWKQEKNSGIKVVFNVFKDEDREIYRNLLFGIDSAVALR